MLRNIILGWSLYLLLPGLLGVALPVEAGVPLLLADVLERGLLSGLSLLEGLTQPELERVHQRGLERVLGCNLAATILLALQVPETTKKVL